ncbi:DUF11 domain-containing protein [Peribacillus alkalitolerans]|uniref:DUF11 domain-containing protein n=1 Tax=Peribacillus alkalitolerans TaxID=1550385 RepID=UPI0013D7B92F|nr:DUF11 domain-containing protein [Peribacillus alkalitolerans]
MSKCKDLCCSTTFNESRCVETMANIFQGNIGFTTFLFDKSGALYTGTISEVIDNSVLLLREVVKFPCFCTDPTRSINSLNRYISICEINDFDLTPPPTADLSLVKTDLPDPVTVGQDLTYTVTVANGGPGTATNVTLTDILPSSVIYGSSSPSQGSCSFAAGTLTCTLGTLASGGTATVNIVVTPTADSVPTISNEVMVIGDEIDPNPANNSDTETTTVNPVTADLSVVKIDSPDPVTVGQDLTYTVTVANGGPDTATDVTLTDILPSSVIYVSSSPSQGSCSFAAGTLTCSLGTLASGGTATVNIVVTPTADSVQTISNVAMVTGNEIDPNPANNSDTETTTVNDS